jgi:hypothetical protein
MERLVGTGRVLLWGTTIDRDWTDLPIRPGYLPLVHQMVLYLGGALHRGKTPMITVGQEQPIPIPRDLQAARVDAPDGKSFSIALEGADGSQAVEGFSLQASEDKDGQNHSLSFTASWVPGLYRVHFKRAGGEFREWKENRFTVLVDPAESDLAPAETEDLKASLPSGARMVAKDGSDEIPLWPYALLLALLLVVLEAGLLTRWASGR